MHIIVFYLSWIYLIIKISNLEMYNSVFATGFYLVLDRMKKRSKDAKTWL